MFFKGNNAPGSADAWNQAGEWWRVYGTVIDIGCIVLLVWLTRREGIRLFAESPSFVPKGNIEKPVQYINDDTSFLVGHNEINGTLTRPASKGRHPAIVLLHGSDRSGKDAPYYREHAETLVQSGFSVLRYDGPGWGGQSSKDVGVETLEYRTEEAITALKYLQSRPDINARGVGLWGISTICVGDDFAPGYFEAMNTWLSNLCDGLN